MHTAMVHTEDMTPMAMATMAMATMAMAHTAHMTHTEDTETMAMPTMAMVKPMVNTAARITDMMWPTKNSCGRSNKWRPSMRSCYKELKPLSEGRAWGSCRQ